jgi:hypothetical protein
VGRFAAYLYSVGSWTELDPEADQFDTPDAPWLYLSIFDSDFATVRYGTNADHCGTAYLGITPRDYFDDRAASEPTDTAAEASGLADWVRLAGTSATTDAAEIEALLVADGAEQPNWDDPDLDPDQIFVEGKCSRFVSLLGLPNPLDL